MNHVALPLEKFIELNRYPQEYFTGDRVEMDLNGNPQLTSKSNYTKGDENFHYATEGITDEGFVTVQFAEESIDDACSKLKDIALGPKTLESRIHMNSLMRRNSEVLFGPVHSGSLVIKDAKLIATLLRMNARSSSESA